MKKGPHIRLATRLDGAGVAEIYAPIVANTAISFEEVAPSPLDMSRRIETNLETHPWLVATRDKLIVGYAYASTHRTRAAYRWSCDVSVYIAKHERRSGVARDLYQQLFSILIAQGFMSAFAGITLPNQPSVGFHEGMGFEPIGIYPNVGFKHGSWHDVGWWYRELQTLANPPMPPSSFDPNRYRA